MRKMLSRTALCTLVIASILASSDYAQTGSTPANPPVSNGATANSGELTKPTGEEQKPMTAVLPEKTVSTDTVVNSDTKEDPKEEPKVEIKTETQVETPRQEPVSQKHYTASRGGSPIKDSPQYDVNSGTTFKLTAYDLSEASCEKGVNHPEFGISASGENLKHQDLRDRKIAVDTRVIPMGSKVYIEFPENFKTVTLVDGTEFNLDGYYTAVDRGGAIKGNKLDLFVGGWDKASHDLAYHIGVRQVTVYRVK